MSPLHIEEAGSRMVEPARRKRKRSPSDLRREAQRSTQRMQEAVRARRDLWPEGANEFVVGRHERAVSGVFSDRRKLRREVYGRRPDLEGRPFHKGQP